MKQLTQGIVTRVARVVLFGVLGATLGRRPQ